jgi:hypothetical protein
VVTNGHAVGMGSCCIIPRMRRLVAVGCLVCLACALAAAPPERGDATIADLRRLFVSPPDDSRIMMRWWWFGPAVTKPELEREMRRMQEGGIGGFEVQPVYPMALDDAAAGIRNLPFLSDEFLDALKFTASKASELGLRMDLTLGSGWPYGGPQVPIAEAAGRLRYEHVAVTPGTRAVPVPAIGAGERLLAVFVGIASADDRGAASGAAARAPVLNGAAGGVAGGSAAGGAAAARASAVRTASTPAPEAFDAASLRQIDLAEVRAGLVRVRAAIAAGTQPRQQMLFFIASRTGMMVKRPALGAEGFVLDHYDRAAIDHYLDTVGTPLLRALDGRPPYAIFCDSLEVFQSDWTGDLLDQFRQRRGYDLTPHLPALVANVGPETNGIRRDWGKTLTELLDERFLAPLHAWAQQHHTRLRLQGYGVPPATISSNALADLPEGEGWQWKQLQSTRWAASASHLYGRPVTSSETWTWLHSPVFRATPLDVKAEADLHFLQGINQLIGHGWPYTAAGVEDPGWRFYAAGVFDDKNPWWIVMPDLARYLQRVSFVLRQGEPANDVALYLPNDDAWARITGGRAHLLDNLRERLGPDVIGGVLDAGFNLDVIDDAALAHASRVDQASTNDADRDRAGTGHAGPGGDRRPHADAAASRVLAIGQGRYRAVVLPGVETIPLDTLRALDAFARAGGIVIATRRAPDRAPGFRATEAEHRQVRELSATLFDGAGARGHLVQDEHIELPRTLAALLHPDIALSPAAPDIGFVHRRLADADLYFLANTSNARQRVTATLRGDAPAAAPRGSDAAVTGDDSRAAVRGDGHGTRAEIWNPLDGTMSAVDARVTPDGRLVMPLDLDAYASRVIVIPHRATGPASTTRAGAGVPEAPGVTATVTRRSGSGSGVPPPIDISSGWSVSFGAQGPPILMDHLRSWIDDDATRDFSGVATYARTVAVPPAWLGGGTSGATAGVTITLDFGDATPTSPHEANPRMQAWLDPPVREAAVVFVNDRRVGAVWCPPYALDVTRALQAGDNRLRIQVANLALNRMASRALPDYRLLNLRYGVRFEAQDMDKIQPLPAGLLGPIRLIPSRP